MGMGKREAWRRNSSGQPSTSIGKPLIGFSYYGKPRKIIRGNQPKNGEVKIVKSPKQPKQDISK